MEPSFFRTFKVPITANLFSEVIAGTILFYVGHCYIRSWKQSLIHPLSEFVSIIVYDMRSTVHIAHGYYDFVVDGGDGGCKLDAMGVVGGGGGEGEGI